MTRKEFIKLSSILGISIPMTTIMSSCSKDDNGMPNNPVIPSQEEKVLIIGAGAAGMTAAYLLAQQGIDFQILEAAATFGGRTKTNTTFADFPISLGAEWLHVERGVLDEIVNDASITVDTETTFYDSNADYALYQGTQLSISDIGVENDQKFINSSWLDFFKQYVVPSIEDKMEFNKVVTAIDYSNDEIIVQTATQEYTANKVIVTIPVKLLQNQAIAFSPVLPTNKMQAINEVVVWDGCKAFIEFSEKFYPAYTLFDVPLTQGDKAYYDAAYGQNTNQNILGLYAVGVGTLPYVQLSDAELISYLLDELDGIFNGQASATYVKHIFQNWNEEPFANGAFLNYNENSQRINTLSESVDNKLFFAGDAYTNGTDFSSVHSAARSAKAAVEELVG
jgi:monoamine oxidase